MSKPSKKEKAILALLEKIEWEGGLEYMVRGGFKSYVKAIDDKELVGLVKTFEKSFKKLDKHLKQLEAKVQAFRSDKSDF